MKTIPLTRGYVALVDDADFALVSAYKWRVATPSGHTAYAISGNTKDNNAILMHRLILGILNDPSVFADHRNGDGLNNQRSNLRKATKQQNQMHQRVQPKPTKSSIYKGVSWCKRTKRWRAHIECLGVRYDLGRHGSEGDAARAYNTAAVRLHGEFAWLNEIASPTGDMCA